MDVVAFSCPIFLSLHKYTCDLDRMNGLSLCPVNRSQAALWTSRASESSSPLLCILISLFLIVYLLKILPSCCLDHWL